MGKPSGKPGGKSSSCHKGGGEGRAVRFNKVYDGLGGDDYGRG